MKCLWYMSLLLFFPTGNKEINKGLYSGTSSFSLSADSISPEPRCILRPVVRQLVYPINLSAEASLCDGYGDEPFTLHRGQSLSSPPPKTAAQSPEARAAVCGRSRRSTNQIVLDKLGIAD